MRPKTNKSKPAPRRFLRFFPPFGGLPFPLVMLIVVLAAAACAKPALRPGAARPPDPVSPLAGDPAREVLGTPRPMPEVPTASAYQHFLRARLLELQGQPLAARQQLILALAFDSGSAFLHNELGWLYLLTHELDKAVPELERAAALDPGWDRPLYLLGEIAFLQNRFELARRRFGEVLAVNPRHPDATRRLSEVIYLKEGAPALTAFLEGKVAADSENSAAWELLVKLYRQEADYPKLEAALGRLLVVEPDNTEAIDRLARWYDRTRRYDRAVELFSRLVDLVPPHPLLHLKLGEFNLKAGKLDEAARAFAEAQAFDVADDRMALAVGFAYLDAGHFASAARQFRSILERGGDPGARYYLGVSLSRQGRLRQAAAVLGEVDDSDPDFRLSAVVEHALILRRLGENAAADRLIERMLARNADDGDAYALAADYRRETKHPSAALRLLEKGLRRLPNDAGLLYARGLLEEDLGREDEALASMRRVLEVDPAHADALNFVGYVYAERNEKLDEAEALIRRAMKLKPEEGYILDSLGWIYYRKGDMPSARRWIRLAAMIEPDEPEILLHLALATRAELGAGPELQAILARAAVLPIPDDEIRRRWEEAFGPAWKTPHVRPGAGRKDSR